MPKLAVSAKVRMNVGNIWIDDWTNLWRYLHPFKILGKGIERSNEKMMSDFSLKVTFSERKTSFPNYFWQRSNEIVSNHQILKLKKSRGIECWKLNNISHLNFANRLNRMLFGSCSSVCFCVNEYFSYISNIIYPRPIL